MSAGCEVSCCPWSWGKYFTTSHTIQNMSSTVSSLAVVDIRAWFSGVEMKGEVKDDTASCCWVDKAVPLEVSCWIEVVDLCRLAELAVWVDERRLLLLPLDFPPCVFGIVLRLAIWRQQILKESYVWRQKLHKLEDYKDYNRYWSNSSLTAHTCGQCTSVNPKYHPLVFGGNTSLLTLLQH